MSNKITEKVETSKDYFLPKTPINETPEKDDEEELDIHSNMGAQDFLKLFEDDDDMVPLNSDAPDEMKPIDSLPMSKGRIKYNLSSTKIDSVYAIDASENRIVILRAAKNGSMQVIEAELISEQVVLPKSLYTGNNAAVAFRVFNENVNVLASVYMQDPETSNK